MSVREMTKPAWLRSCLAERLNACGCSFARAIHPSAQIARNAQIGPGAIVMANVAIYPGTNIGTHTVVSTSASLEAGAKKYEEL